MSLSHVEVLSEVLVSAPPVSVDHTDSLISSHLMEVGVSNVVLLTVSWQTSIRVRVIVVSVVVTNVPSPVRNHILLLLLGQQVEHERLVQVEDKQHVHDSNPILVLETGDFPEGIAEWVFEESCNILESPPFLGFISGLLGLHHKLSEITIGLLSEGPTDHFSALIHVWEAIHHTLNTHESLSEVGLGIFTIVQVLRHFFINLINYQK